MLAETNISLFLGSIAQIAISVLYTLYIRSWRIRFDSLRGSNDACSTRGSEELPATA